MIHLFCISDRHDDHDAGGQRSALLRAPQAAGIIFGQPGTADILISISVMNNTPHHYNYNDGGFITMTKRILLLLVGDEGGSARVEFVFFILFSVDTSRTTSFET
jgi:hypothetical protein